jgi:hypothetical protein
VITNSKLSFQWDSPSAPWNASKSMKSCNFQNFLIHQNSVVVPLSLQTAVSAAKRIYLVVLLSLEIKIKPLVVAVDY